MSRQWTVDELDEALHALGRSIDAGTPPDYATRVATQLGDRTRPAAPLRAVRRRTILLAAAVLVALGLVSVPATRQAIASWFSFGGVDIHRAPPTSPLPTPSFPASLNAGPAVTRAEASAATRGRLVVPSGLPAPSDIYLYEDGATAVVTLTYRTVPGLTPTPDTGLALIVTEIFDAGRPYIEKILHTGATADAVSVSGHRGVFVAGPQAVLMIERGSIAAPVNPRASANTLIWGEDAVTFRIEADFSEQEALALAEQITPN